MMDRMITAAGPWLFGRNGALFYAAAEGLAPLARELLKQGAKATASSSRGYTPLHRAAQHGHAEVVRLLLQHHANPHARAENGDTPLSLAQAANQPAIAQLLENNT